MNYKMYCIYDRKSMLYGNPFYQVNEGTAIRYYGIVASKDKVVALDTELYCCGEYDCSKGIGVFYDKPEFVINGCEVVENE